MSRESFRLVARSIVVRAPIETPDDAAEVIGDDLADFLDSLTEPGGVIANKIAELAASHGVDIALERPES